MSVSITELHKLGQSLWYDNIQRQLLESGEMEEMIKRGDIRGVTSNPTIFQKAIADSSDYDAALKPMAWAGQSSEQIFWQLAVEDIRSAADLFLPLYKETNKADGYVSLEVSPYLANDTEKTLFEAKRLWKLVERPNLMIKIPATKNGIPAIRDAIAEGINVNATLIFSLSRYAEVIDAYIDGLEMRINAGLPVDSIASVASFFVSRVDSKVDDAIRALISDGKINTAESTSLIGKAGLANSRLAYSLFLENFSSPEAKHLLDNGARVQRPLWASTSTKNPELSDVLYIEGLIAPDTVNTVPPHTLDAFRDHGIAQKTIEGTNEISQQILKKIEDYGIHMEKVTLELEEEGVRSFADSFTQLLETIESRRKNALAELGDISEDLTANILKHEETRTIERLYTGDASIWSDVQNEQIQIRQRLGWLQSPYKSTSLLKDIYSLISECQVEGYSDVLLLGMGGSSLAPEVLASTFGVREGTGKLGLNLTILDSTDPVQINEAANRSLIHRTLFIVSSKSGTTLETLALFQYFWAMAEQELGDKAPNHFVAITDPGTKLEELAKEKNFRRTFLSDPDVGGRYSALTAFGLVPAGLIGLDLEQLLERARNMEAQCKPTVPTARNPGLVLGTILGISALKGRDKLTFLCDPEISSFGSWLEQLIAESSGKQNKGIIPIDLEPIAENHQYSDDRFFVYLRLNGRNEEMVQNIKKGGHPVLVLQLKDEYDLAAQFFLWEIATAVACAVLGVNAFDQPDVQVSKDRTNEKILEFQSKKSHDEGQLIYSDHNGDIYGTTIGDLESGMSLSDIVDKFLDLGTPGDYVAINAYLPRNSKTLTQLQALRASILKKTKLATTLGFGPRFLHSTGQLHKGGPNKGLFIQITMDHEMEQRIPGQDFSFNNLIKAQSLGDHEALIDRKRRVIRIHLKDGSLEDLVEG